MKKRQSAVLGIAVTSVVTSTGAIAAETSQSSKPNIIFIFADDWGWGDLTCHGSKYVKTPNLDKMASEGTDFQCFNVSSPVCSPSRAAVMTGQYPVRNKIYQHFGPLESTHKRQMPDLLDPNLVMLPKLLQSAGYKTAHYGKWHLCSNDLKDAPKPTQYGYDEYGIYSDPFLNIPESDNTYFDKSIEFIKKNKNKPFFINLWIHQAHAPHYPKKEWLEKFKDLDDKHKVYAAVIAEGDAGVGAILDTLKELNIDGNTLVMFSSDNGPERRKEKSKNKREGLGLYYSVGETGGLRGRKRSLFEGGVRVPFICRWPDKMPAGKVNKESVITAVDLLPTLCAAAGAKLPEGYKPDGENMLDVFTGSDRKRTRPIFWEWTGSHADEGWPHFSIRDGDWKLVMVSPNERVELFNVVNDREEKKNLADQNPEKVQELMKKLQAWIKTIPMPEEKKKTPKNKKSKKKKSKKKDK
jgi:N-acetylgalactosamine-6-sulfatase